MVYQEEWVRISLKKKIFGKSLIELVVLRSKKQVQKLIINSNKPKSSWVGFGVEEIINDCMSGNLGPLVGILSGLKWAKVNTKSDWLVSFPVDSPFFPEDLVFKFLEKSNNCDILMAESVGRIHPVFSMWKINSRIENELYNSLKNNERKIDSFTKKFKTGVVKFPDIGYDPFFNVNTLEDLEEAKTIYRGFLK